MKNKKKIILVLSLLLISAPLISIYATDGVKGKILLQVESHGEAWYVDSSTEERIYMGRPTDAFSLMRTQGIGITNDNLSKIAVGENNLNTSIDTDDDGLSDVIEDAFGTDKNKKDTDSDGIDDKQEVLSGYSATSSDSAYLIDDDFAENQAGKILLQVENNGESWYVNPDDNKRYFLGEPTDAFNIMKTLGLGISDSDLEKIKISNNTEIASSTNAMPNMNSASSTNAMPNMNSASSTNAMPNMNSTSNNRSMPDLSAAASTLGVTEEALKEALGDPSQGAPNFATAAQILGVTESALMAALNL